MWPYHACDDNKSKYKARPNVYTLYDVNLYAVRAIQAPPNPVSSLFMNRSSQFSRQTRSHAQTHTCTLLLVPSGAVMLHMRCPRHRTGHAKTKQRGVNDGTRGIYKLENCCKHLFLSSSTFVQCHRYDIIVSREISRRIIAVPYTCFQVLCVGAWLRHVIRSAFTIVCVCVWLKMRNAWRMKTEHKKDGGK